MHFKTSSACITVKKSLFIIKISCNLLENFGSTLDVSMKDHSYINEK